MVPGVKGPLLVALCMVLGRVVEEVNKAFPQPPNLSHNHDFGKVRVREAQGVPRPRPFLMHLGSGQKMKGWKERSGKKREGLKEKGEGKVRLVKGILSNIGFDT